MDLDNRKMRILKAIVRTYLETGEPVGSRTISKEEGLSVSPATVRNEMADLEEMGLIIQPHTSAGRIPTDKGYRFYVNELMGEAKKEILNVTGLMNRRMDRVESILKRMGQMLAQRTNYATMISGPRYTENELKFIQLSKLDSRHLIAVIVVEGNVVRNRLLDIDVPVTDQDLLNLNVLLNSALQGKSLDDLTISFMKQLLKQAGEHGEVIKEVLEAVVETIEESTNEAPELFTSGTTNLFKYPELSETSMATEILRDMENEAGLLDLLSNDSKEDSNIRFYIGSEAPMSGLKNCSIVTADYELGRGIRGKIGIIGPKRMDYEHVVGTLKTMIEELSHLNGDE